MAPSTPMDDERRMSLIEHLTELRDRLIKCVIAIVVGMVAGFFLYHRIFDILIEPYKQIAEDHRTLTDGLVVFDPLEGFSVRMKVSAYTGIGLAMPVILWQIWQFVTPGLYPHERRYALPFVVTALVLFVMGAGLAYYTLPRALEFLATIGGEELVAAYSPGKYFSLVVYMMLAFGVGFEFPILLVFLQMAGIVEPSHLAQLRRYAIVGITILVAVITPSGDPISMLMLSVPMVIFYEASILIGKVIERRRTAAERV